MQALIFLMCVATALLIQWQNVARKLPSEKSNASDPFLYHP